LFLFNLVTTIIHPRSNYIFNYTTDDLWFMTDTIFHSVTSLLSVTETITPWTVVSKEYRGDVINIAFTITGNLPSNSSEIYNALKGIDFNTTNLMFHIDNIGSEFRVTSTADTSAISRVVTINTPMLIS